MTDAAPKPPRPGVLTTEFWMSLTCLLVGALFYAGGDRELGAALMAVAVGPYAISRGLAKRKGPWRA